MDSSGIALCEPSPLPAGVFQYEYLMRRDTRNGALHGSYTQPYDCTSTSKPCRPDPIRSTKITQSRQPAFEHAIGLF